MDAFTEKIMFTFFLFSLFCMTIMLSVITLDVLITFVKNVLQ